MVAHQTACLVCTETRLRNLWVSLLGVSAAELGGRAVGLDDLGWPTLAEMPDRLASTLTWSEQFDNLAPDVA